MSEYSIFMQLNAFKDKMVRLGDGLRMSLITYRELNKKSIYVAEETLYNMLTDLSTFTSKHSLQHFYHYIVEYLMSEGEYISDESSYELSELYYYIAPDETEYEELKLPLPLFDYFHLHLWDEIVKLAIYDFLNKDVEHPPRNICISFNDYKKLYPNSNVTDEELCINFLDNLDSFLRYNHIIKMEEFNLGGNGLDLYIPLQFKFTKLH